MLPIPAKTAGFLSRLLSPGLAILCLWDFMSAVVSQCYDCLKRLVSMLTCSTFIVTQ